MYDACINSKFLEKRLLMQVNDWKDKEEECMAENRYNFQKLTPTNKVDLNIYKDALDYVFNNTDVKNVGISGAYSSGKSSVIETYKKLKPDITFLHISLAYFQSTSKSKKENIELDEKMLEGKIINQLIHQIDPDNIPQTDFKVKRRLSFEKLWLITSLTCILVILLMYILNFSAFVNYIETLSPMWVRLFLEFITMPLSVLVAGIICSAILFCLILEIIRMQFNKNIFKGISVQGNTIELFAKSEESYFDKHLNEVLYLFEHSGADVIIFEDMDRYNTNQIFQRLREINTLINNQRKKSGKVLRFFYLIRDDIFVSKERTKFFDFIMPVVPVLDGSNSYDQFINHFKQGGIFKLFDEYFLQGISLYIDDMRILKNIYNEFLVYYNCISTTGQDPNKLLAIVVYKNIFPRDFSDLQLNRGFVYTLFSKKKEFTNDEVECARKKIEELRQSIIESEKENLKSNEEVDKIYDPQIQSMSHYNSQRAQREVLSKESETRKENIKNRLTEQRNNIISEINELETNIVTLTNRKLYQIINKKNIAEVFKITYINEVGSISDFNEIKSSDYFDLIKFLIRKGFIDETYPDYITYFYENSLSRVDKIFLRSVTDEQPKEFTYELKNLKMVTSRLSLTDFNNEETLNFDLLDYLLEHQVDVNKDKLSQMLKQIKRDKNFKFISLYISIGKKVSCFIACLHSEWGTVFDSIIFESNFTYEQKKQYALESIYYTSNNILETMNTRGTFTVFISSSSDFLNISEPNIKRLIEIFNLLHIKFTTIDYEISEKELFNAVYTNNLYIINFELVCLVLKVIYESIDINELKHKNYTLLLTKPTEPVVTYIKANINDYITMVLENCDDNITDSEEIVLVVLNDEELESTLKCEYIEYLQTAITSLQEIKDVSLWPKLLRSKLVTYAEDNVLQYFCRSGNRLDNLLTSFINNHAGSFNFNYDDINKNFEDGEGKTFLFYIIKSKELDVAPYAGILRSLKRELNSFDIDGITDDKMAVLIAQRIITMKSEVLLFMREKYPHKVISFIKRNIKKYAEEVISEEIFDFDEMIEVFKLDVDDQYKTEIIQYTEVPISVLVDSYSDELKTHIVRNNFKMDDIPHLSKDYPILGEGFQSSIENIVIRYLDDIIGNQFFVPLQLAKKIFAVANIPHDNRVQLFALILPGLKKEECKECLLILDLKEYLSVFKGKRPTVLATDTNQTILEMFSKRHWIVGYGLDKKDNSLYRISSRRVPRKQTLPTELL